MSTDDDSGDIQHIRTKRVGLSDHPPDGVALHLYGTDQDFVLMQDEFDDLCRLIVAVLTAEKE